MISLHGRENFILKVLMLCEGVCHSKNRDPIESLN